MSEEELEARHLINVLEDKKFTAQGEALRTYIEELNKKIDKLQKENEELENNFSKQWQEFRTTHISKDKIRTKIKELEIEKCTLMTIQPSKDAYNYCIKVLKELLGDDE